MTARDLLRLKGVHPELVKKITTILSKLPMFVVQGLRTAEAQHLLWLQGRDPKHPGRIVTNCDGYKIKSNHQAKADGFGHAVDLAFIPTKTYPDPFDQRHPWRDYGALGESMGLVWGGRFKLRDLDHLELS